MVRQIQRCGRLEEDFKRLFREYEPQIRASLLKAGWLQSDAEDLCQEIFLRVYRGIGIESFDSRSSFEAWMWTVVRNARSNARRKAVSKKPENWSISLEPRPEPDDDDGPALPELVDPGRDPLDQVLAEERSKLLQEALDRLPKGVRRCLLLRLHGWSDKEIARLLDVAVATVRKQVQKGRKRLRAVDGLLEVLGLTVVLALLG